MTQIGPNKWPYPADDGAGSIESLDTKSENIKYYFLNRFNKISNSLLSVFNLENTSWSLNGFYKAIQNQDVFMLSEDIVQEYLTLGSMTIDSPCFSKCMEMVPKTTKILLFPSKLEDFLSIAINALNMPQSAGVHNWPDGLKKIVTLNEISLGKYYRQGSVLIPQNACFYVNNKKGIPIKKPSSALFNPQPVRATSQRP